MESNKVGIAAAVQVLKRTVQDFGDDDAQTYAAAIAYYTVFSLPSLLPIVLFAAGLIFGGAAVSGKIQSTLSESAGPEVAGLLQRAVVNATLSRGGVIATVLGAAGLIFSATTTFVNLQQALNRMWDVSVERSAAKGFAVKRLKCFLVIVSISMLILVSLIASTALSAAIKMVRLPIPNSLVYGIDLMTSLILFTALFAILFKVLPDVQVEWRDVWAGAAFTSILFIIGKFLIAMYLTHSGSGSVYGAAGSLALLLLWTYYSANILLLGAEFVQAWSHHHGRQLMPAKGAVRTGRKGNGGAMGTSAREHRSAPIDGSSV